MLPGQPAGEPSIRSPALFSSSSAGTYTITATSQQDSTKTGTATVNVAQGVNNALTHHGGRRASPWYDLREWRIRHRDGLHARIRQLARPSIMCWSIPARLASGFLPTERQVENSTRRRFRCRPMPAATRSANAICLSMASPGDRCPWQPFRWRARRRPPFRMQPWPECRSRSSAIHAFQPCPSSCSSQPSVSMRAI